MCTQFPAHAWLKPMCDACIVVEFQAFAIRKFIRIHPLVRSSHPSLNRAMFVFSPRGGGTYFYKKYFSRLSLGLASAE